jgi:HEAT repeat protein
VQAVLDALRNKDASGLRFALADVLSPDPTPEVRAVVLAALADPDPLVIEAAYNATFSWGASPELIEALVLALAGPHVQGRTRAAQKLGWLAQSEEHVREAYPAAIAALMQALADPSPELRGSAAQALGQFRATEAVPPLVALVAGIGSLDDAVDGPARAAAEALATIGVPEAAPALARALPAEIRRWGPYSGHYTGKALVAAGEAAVDPLIAELPEASPAAQARICQVLEQVGSARAIPALRPLVEAEDETVQIAAVRALVVLGDREVAPMALARFAELAARWQSPDPEWAPLEIDPSDPFFGEKIVAAEAQEAQASRSRSQFESLLGALGAMATPDAHGALIDYLAKSGNEQLRVSAARALAQKPGAAAEKYFREARARGDLPVIAGAWRRFRGSERQDLLLRAFEKFGDLEMAQEFVNSGLVFEAAARDWAHRHGYTVISLGDGLRVDRNP